MILSRQRCTECPHKECPLVRGTGPRGKFMVVGEAPGQDEVKKGIPFIGDSGRLLRSTLQACGVDPTDVYFTNSVICHPPGNETPSAAMVNSCRGDLLKEILDIRPKKILAVGATALQALSGTAKSVGITKTHGLGMLASIDPGDGSSFDVYLMPTFHPAYILRNEDAFRSFAYDIEKFVRNTRPLEQPEIVIKEVNE